MFHWLIKLINIYGVSAGPSGVLGPKVHGTDAKQVQGHAGRQEDGERQARQ